MRFYIIVLAAIIYSLSRSASAEEEPQAKLTVYLIGCTTRASLNVFDLARQRDLTTTMQLRPGPSSDMQIASIMLPGGYYEVDAGRLPCTASRHVVMLDGSDRNIVLKGGDVLHLTEGLSGLGGSIPIDDLSVAATCESGTRKVEYVAQISGRTYYFDDIEAPASCVVRMRTTGRYASDITSSPTIPIDRGERLAIYNFAWPTSQHR